MSRVLIPPPVSMGEWKQLPYPYCEHLFILKSDEDRVWSAISGLTLSLEVTRKGYLRFSCHTKELFKHFSMHLEKGRLFIPNPENKPYFDHIDGNPSNNALSNLRPCYPSENQRNKGLAKNNKTGFK